MREGRNGQHSKCQESGGCLEAMREVVGAGEPEEVGQRGKGGAERVGFRAVVVFRWRPALVN